MVICWDPKADKVVKGDKLREITPIYNKTYKDAEEATHYVFKKIMFNNPKYKIPKGKIILFKRFLDGGSRSYPSDGAIPLDIAATETRIILNEIMNIASDPSNPYHSEAKDAVRCGKYSLVRGCVKLYLKKYTTRDWRRKRFTDDIDFWIHKVALFEHILKKNGWQKNSVTKEWGKRVSWMDPYNQLNDSGMLIASNDLNQSMDFGNCSYLDGSDLKSILKKKLMRGHDVDLSDVINVAMVNYSPNDKKDINSVLVIEAINESANTRGTRTISNLISLCRYSFSIADYIKKIGVSIGKYRNTIFDREIYPDSKLKRICRYSSNWMGYLINNGADSTRNLIYAYLIQQQTHRRKYSQNLRLFAEKVLKIVNSKLTHINTVILIE